jgi:hypothetical protein
VSARSAIRFVSQAREFGHVDLRKPKKRNSKLDPYRSAIIGWIGEQPDLTLAELCALLAEEHGLHAGSSTLDDWRRGRSAKGQRLVASIPHAHWKTMTACARHGCWTGPWMETPSPLTSKPTRQTSSMPTIMREG